MPGPVVYVPSRVGEGYFTDWQAPVAGDNGRVWAYNHGTGKFEPYTIPTVAPGGSSGYIQYNNAGAFGASGVYWDSVNSRVGIGTASPTGKLEISSASSVVIRYSGSSATDYRNEYYRNGSRIGLFSWDTGLFGLEADSANSVAIRFVTGGSERLRINSSGNVGIGTTSPGQKLDVNGSVNVATALIVPVVRPAADSTSAWKVTKADGTTAVVTVDTANGRVGIGTVSPIGEIEASSSETVQYLTTTSSNLGSYLILRNGAIDIGSMQALGPSHATFANALRFRAYQSSGVIDFAAGGALGTHVRIGDTGNVGIGTTSPNSKLDVAGTVQMDGLRIDVAPTPETVTATHTITFSANGTNYKLLCVPA